MWAEFCIRRFSRQFKAVAGSQFADHVRLSGSVKYDVWRPSIRFTPNFASTSDSVTCPTFAGDVTVGIVSYHAVPRLIDGFEDQCRLLSLSRAAKRAD